MTRLSHPIRPIRPDLQMIGNAALLDLPDKVAGLSSRRISAADVSKSYELVEKGRNGNRCSVAQETK